MNHTIWIYPFQGIMFAKRNPFDFYIPRMDHHTGEIMYEIVQGTPMPKPTWEWKQARNGKIFAKYGTSIFDVTDIELM
jgi:hypothetical protein